MVESDVAARRAIPVWRYAVLLGIMWAATVAGLLRWNIHQVQQEIIETAQVEARSYLDKHLAFREWAVSHGGVYVPVDSHTRPNPYLNDVPERDILTPSGTQLTLMNPDYMLRQIMERFGSAYGVSGRIISLYPVRPENTPDSWERAGLEAFEHGVSEISEVTQINEKTYLRMMRPMTAQAECLKCHQEPRFLEGGVIGASSVSTPMAALLDHQNAEVFTLVWSYGLVGALGLSGIGLFSRQVHRRIHERDSVQEALAKSEEQLSFAIDASGAGLWDWTLPAGETLVNRRLAEMLGYTLEELSPMSQKTWEKLCHPDDLVKSRAILQEHFSGVRAFYECEERLKHKDGHWIWVLDRGRVTAHDAQGRPSRMTGTHIDITERKRAEEALSRSREQLNLAIEGSGVGMWDWMVLEGLTYINERGAEILGYSQNEISPLNRETWEQLCHPDDLKRWRAQLDKHFAGESPIYECEERLKHKDGHWVWVLHRGRVTERDANGRPVRMTGTHLDITERKRAREDHERLTLAIEQSTETVLITDVSGAIVYVNPAFERITGYSREEVIGKNPSILKSGKHDESFYRKMWDTLSSGSTWRGQVVNKRKDGGLYTEEATISPVRDASGQTVNYVAVKRDVTREINLEAQLYQARRMEAVGRLAGGIAHDFNNLLQAILGYTELLLDDPALNDSQRSELEQVLAAARRAAQLTRQMLAFSRRQVLQPVDLNLNEMIADLAKMLKRVIGENIHLDVIPGHRLGTVHADRGQLEQVLMNLCINARDAMPHGGRLTIETQNVVIDGEYCRDHPWAIEGRYILISVTDTGCGIDPDTLNQIFEPFFTTKEVGKGTGLGLATVYGIVKQHDGMVQVYSELDKGAMFKVYLPMVERPAGAVGAHLQGPVPGGRETVLVAEDDEAVRDLANRILTDAGYTVLTARDGESAVQLIDQYEGEIHLAILDIVMPKLGGREVEKRLQEVRPKARVVFTSGYSENAVHTNFVMKEGLQLLQKPYQRDGLLRIVRSALDA